MANKKTVLEIVEEKCITIKNCWKWTGATNNEGKPIIRRFGIILNTKRALKEEIDGITYPRNLIIRSACDNDLCCNPDHLEVVTIKDNFSRIVQTRKAADKQRTALYSVERNSKTKPGGCWEWQGTVRTTQAYGEQPVIGRNGRQVILRQALYEEQTGEKLTKEQYVSAKCGNSLCCNPEHLFVITKPKQKRVRKKSFDIIANG